MKYRYYYLLLLTTILSHFILYAPYELNRNLFDGSFVAIFLALIISCINAYMTIYVYNTYKGSNILDINKILMGKYLGGLFSLFTILFNVLVSFFMFRGLIEIIMKFMLPSTPAWFLAITFLFLPYINLLNDNKSFLNFIAFISLFIIVWSILYVLLSIKGIHMYYIKTAVIHSIKLPNFATLAAAGFFFSGVSHLSVFNPEFKKINWKKTCLVYIFIALPVALFAIYVPVGVLGPYMLQKTQLTAVTTADSISVDLFFIERALYILLPLFFLLSASDFIIFGYVSWSLMKSFIKNKKISFFAVNIIGASYIILSYLIKDTETMLRLGSLCITWALIYHLLFTTLLFILTKLKEGKNV